MSAVGRVLRGRATGGPALVAVAFGGAAYGAVMGSYGGATGERALQLLYSALKVPMLLMLTAGLALPSFFVLNTLLGLRNDFARAVRAVILAQSVVAVTLAALAPLVLVVYTAGPRYQAATACNGAAFLVASLAAQWRLRRAYRPLIQRNPWHRLTLRAWLVVYVFVGVQLAWNLRPFVGDPARRPTFLREGPWTNAYVALSDVVTGTLSR